MSKFRKLLAFLLVACLLFGSVSMLFSCKPNPEPPVDPDDDLGAPEKPDDPGTKPVIPGTVTYTIMVVDQYDRPIQGVVVQMFNDAGYKLPALTNANGVATFQYPEAEYSVNVTVPAGYQGATEYKFAAGEKSLQVVLTEVVEAPEYITGDKTTVTVPAGETLDLALSIYVGMSIVINDANAVVTYNGATYVAKDGKVKVDIAENIPGHAVKFSLSTADGQADTFVIELVDRNADEYEGFEGMG
ncbi:MAG: hypothetical protein IJY04_08835, partial [Clostridia bacterium]|nr:hypothetical protein [Clostridia bacterium]